MAGEEGFGGTFAEVDGESDAVAVEAGEDHHLFAAWMAAEDGAHFFGVEDGAAPTVRNAHGCKGRVQMADAAFEPAETAGGLASANIVAVQIVRAVPGRVGGDGSVKRRAVGGGDEAGTEDDAVRIEQASPQIRKVEGVKRAPRGEADGPELRCGQRGSGKRKGEFRLGGGAQARQFQGGGIGGEKDLLGADFFPVDAPAEFAADVQAQRIGEVQGANLGVLNDLGAGVFRSASQTGEHFARVNRAARHEADDFQLAGIAPGDG